MFPFIYFLSIAAVASGAAFVPTHILYWTQPSNCSLCSPELFHWSITSGVVFIVANVLLARSIASGVKPATGSIASIRSVAWQALKISGVALLSCILLIGLFLLPLAVAWTVLRYIRVLLNALPRR